MAWHSWRLGWMVSWGFALAMAGTGCFGGGSGDEGDSGASDEGGPGGGGAGPSGPGGSGSASGCAPGAFADNDGAAMPLPVNAPITSAVGISGVVVFGDFDDDGALDAAGQAEEGIAVALGEGDGRFDQAIVVHDGSVIVPYALHVADLDGDGVDDLVLGRRGDAQSDGTWVGALTVLFGGAEFPAESADTTSGPLNFENHLVATGDFDGDGRTDIAGCNAASCMMARGEGGRSFEVAESFGGPMVSACLTAGDLDDDGRDELAASTFPFGEWSIFHRSTSGAWSVDMVMGNIADSGGGCQVSADFDGDGERDVVGPSILHDATIAISYNRGPDTLDTAGFCTYLEEDHDILRDSALTDVDVGDLDGDGVLDLVVLDGGRNTLSFLGGRPGGKAFRMPTEIDPELGELSQVTLADVDADGALDVLVTHSGEGGLSVMLGG